MRKTTPHHRLMETIGKSLGLALEYRDSSTFLHSSRVVLLAQELGEKLKLSSKQMSALWLTSIFHDIGKIGVPDEVLKKIGKLNKKEFEVIKNHAAISGEILQNLGVAEAKELSKIARHHHEFFNGKGYPDGLRGEEIPYLSRVISLADCYDAMTSNRIYRPGMTHESTIEMMKTEVWKKFDPEISSVFFEMIEHSEHKAV